MQGNAPSPYMPPIFDFAGLFDRSSKAPPGGLPVGSVIVLRGPPGAGKSTFALALVRSLLHQESSEQREPRHRFYFISVESDRDHLRKLYRKLAWFGEQDPLFGDGPGCPLELVTPALEMDRPVPSSQDRVNQIFRALDERRSSESQGQLPRPSFVVVDSLSALLGDCRSSAEWRRQAQEFIQRVKRDFKYHSGNNGSATAHHGLGLLFLLTESDTDRMGEASIEDYLADFVIRLALKPTEPNTVRRVLSVTKSRGANMALGESSWAILEPPPNDETAAEDPWKRVLFLDPAVVRKEIKAEVGAGTIAVFPRPRLRPIGNVPARSITVPPTKPGPELLPTGVPGLDEMPLGESDCRARPPAPPTKPGPERLPTGVPGLDEMLLGESDYWARPPAAKGQLYAKHTPALIPGTTTLVLGAPGTGKTTMCLQFLLADGDDSPTFALYVAFEHALHSARQLYPGDASERERLKKVRTVHRRRGNLDVNLLIAEIRFELDRAERDGDKHKRVALDGLGTFLASSSRDEAVWLLETLLEVILDYPKTTLMISCEVDPGQLASHVGWALMGVSAVADNVVVLKHIRISDQLRKAIYIEKARGMDHDRAIREISVTSGQEKPLRIHHGLEGYTGLLTDSPEPVNMVLQLFAENDAEQRYNAWLEAYLKQRFHYPVKSFSFSRHELTRGMEDATSCAAGRLPDTDIRVLSVDTWWVREHPVLDGPDGSQSNASVDHPLLKLVPLEATDANGTSGSSALTGSTERDFWTFEIEKTTAVRWRGDDTKQGEPKYVADLLAIPAYTDFGLFCVNAELLGTVLLNDDAAAAHHISNWPSALQNLPRVWARAKGTWFEDPVPAHIGRADASLVDWMAYLVEEARRQRARWCGGDLPKRCYGFSCDLETPESIACIFFELAWSFGEPEDFLRQHALQWISNKVHDPDKWLDGLPCVAALRFLQFLVFNDLMSERAIAHDVERSFFARHFYSTFCDEVDRAKQRRTPTAEVPSPSTATTNPTAALDNPILILPFMPVGPALDPCQSEHAVLRTLADCFVRIERTARRMYAVAGNECHRNALLVIRQVAREAHAELDGLDGKTPMTGARPTGTHMRTARYLLRRLRRECEHLRPDASGKTLGYTSAGVYIPPARSTTDTDAREQIKWHEFLLRTVEGQLENRALSAVVSEFDRSGELNPDLRLAHLEKRSEQPHAGDSDESPDGATTCLTGYSCSGSWSFAVYRKTQRPLLSSKIVSEMVSLDAARERAKLGAGLPARKDFYEFHGHEAVTNAEYLSWRQLLTFCAARGRRRDRVFCSAIPAASFYSEIARGVLDCLSVAHRYRASPPPSRDARTDPKWVDHKAAAEEQMRNAARQTMRAIIRRIAEDMQHRASSAGIRHCSECLVPAECPVFAAANDPTRNPGGGNER
ncbi:MAG: AAA family ATPase [Polyangiaceae bacterium]|nr:AAA family ATPase [Polyangiaceae bacterium]